MLNKYYEDKKPMVYGIGVSMGAGILSNIMGLDGMKNPSRNYFDGAVGVAPPMKLP